MAAVTLKTPIGELNGIGKVRESQLKKLGISTAEDLIYLFPRAYEMRGNIRNLSDCDPDKPCAFLLTVANEVKQSAIRRGLTISRFRAFDESGSVDVTFFNAPYIKDVFHTGSTFRFWGKVSIQKGKLQLVNPKYEPYIEGVPLADFVPVYPLTDGISSKQLDKLVKSLINDILPQIKDPIPENIRIQNSLPTLTYAIKNTHFPESQTALSKSLSRLAFDEMLYFGIGISLSASHKSRSEGERFNKVSLDELTAKLPYELTDSQKQAINDIYRDTVIGSKGKISNMARIIVGDVGCGKTICALAAMYIAAKSGYQSALMVPTEILAKQHFNEAEELLGSLGIRCALLLGSTTAKDKRQIKKALAEGEIDVIIGTHALITDDVDFASLRLVITDEQHRFGVAQRARLKEKSNKAHLLVMSATPIPRTLALTMYGDLDISRITEMPKGRQRVDTFVVNEEYRTRLNDFIKKQVALGGQCYVVCPSIERAEDEIDEMIPASTSGQMVATSSLNLKNAVEFAEQLQKNLPEVRIAVLHGRMKNAEKDEIMSRFASGEVDVLVSTTVIEVGVNVPNASLMIVENAERFGLSQLHQLRGRVGRGRRKSYCVLVSDINSPKSRDRLVVMRTTYDGYEIAEKDLVLRGPGDFFSSISDNNLRQSGGFDFKFASICDNSDMLSAAFSAAKAIVTSDPKLELSEHSALRKKLKSMLDISSSTIS